MATSTQTIEPTEARARTTEAVLTELARTIDTRHIRTRKQGGINLSYVPWPLIVRHLHYRAPGFCWEIREVQQIGEYVSVTGRLTIPTTDGPLLFENVASESLNGSSHAPPIECAASAALRRCAACAGLGLELWED
jgi:hypothetical protein